MKRKIISLVLAMSMLMSAVLTVSLSADDESPFVDVTDKEVWYYNDVIAAYNAGLVNGKLGNRFDPEANMTRAEAVTVLRRLVGLTEDDVLGLGASLSFTDTEEHWAADSIGWAVENSIVKGYDNGDGSFSFGPDLDVKRQELAVMIAGFLKSFKFAEPTEEPRIDKFADADTFVWWYEDSVEIMREMGLIGGDQYGNFQPAKTATRAEIAAILNRFPEYIGDEPEYDNVGDPTPDNIGVLYEDESGLKISYADLITDENGNAVTANGTGVHGGHEMKVARTPYGTYVVYITDETGGRPNYNIFTVVKVTSEGNKVIFSNEFPKNNGAAAPTIMYDGSGKLFVTVLADDSSYSIGQESAYLAEYVFDAKTGEKLSEAVNVFPYKITKVHGYSYTQPILDKVNGKIYGLFSGGAYPGYLAWFIYDIETATWDSTCYTDQLDFRMAYYNGFADGNGGFVVVGQRDVLRSVLSEALGVSFFGGGSGYVWDALYLIKVADATVESIETTTIWEPQYSTTERNETAKANHYGDGATHIDKNGNIHVLYSTYDGSTLGSVLRSTVFDMDMNVVVPEQQIIPSFGSTQSTSAYTAYAEGTDGTMYIILINRSASEATIEIMASKDGGETYSTVVAPQTLTCEDGTPIEPSKIIVSGPRNNSIRDNVIGIITFNGSEPYSMYYFSIELPAK